jgi:hypothetical protein
MHLPSVRKPSKKEKDLAPGTSSDKACHTPRLKTAELIAVFRTLHSF